MRERAARRGKSPGRGSSPAIWVMPVTLPSLASRSAVSRCWSRQPDWLPRPEPGPRTAIARRRRRSVEQRRGQPMPNVGTNVVPSWPPLSMHVTHPMGKARDRTRAIAARERTLRSHGSRHRLSPLQGAPPSRTHRWPVTIAAPRHTRPGACSPQRTAGPRKSASVMDVPAPHVLRGSLAPARCGGLDACQSPLGTSGPFLTFDARVWPSPGSPLAWRSRGTAWGAGCARRGSD